MGVCAQEVRVMARQLKREIIILTTAIISADDFIYGFVGSEPDCQRSVASQNVMQMVNIPF